jgi:hypothetical protein
VLHNVVTAAQVGKRCANPGNAGFQRDLASSQVRIDDTSDEIPSASSSSQESLLGKLPTSSCAVAHVEAIETSGCWLKNLTRTLHWRWRLRSQWPKFMLEKPCINLDFLRVASQTSRPRRTSSCRCAASMQRSLSASPADCSTSVLGMQLQEERVFPVGRLLLQDADAGQIVRDLDRVLWRQREAHTGVLK